MTEFNPKSGFKTEFRDNNGCIREVFLYDDNDNFVLLHDSPRRFSFFDKDAKLDRIVCNCDERPSSNFIEIGDIIRFNRGYHEQFGRDKSPSNPPESYEEMFNYIKESYAVSKPLLDSLKKKWITIHSLKSLDKSNGIRQYFTFEDKEVNSLPQNYVDILTKISKYDYVKGIFKVDI
ncbi:MAG: hypothetical protein WC755_05170 [Candidatus Woesearchaeota archaeon]|jgi:hypothetical protein